MANTLEHDILETGAWQRDEFLWMENVNSIVNELQADHITLNAANDAIRAYDLTHCVTPPNFELDTDLDIQNGDAFEIVVNGVYKTVATDQSFDTGTAAVIGTNAYWACGLLSIDVDATTHVDFGAEAVSEAAAKLLLSAVTASGSVVCGYVAVEAAAGQAWTAGTDGLTGGSSGQVANATTYYNDVKVGAAYVASAAAIAAPAALTNSTALKLTKG